MSINIPNKPADFKGNPKDKDYAAKLQEHQNEMMIWQMTVQAAQNQQNQESTMATNLQKSNHDVLMNVARNIAG